ncbi:MAG: hypothetical protein IH936_11410 [Acidobacteria bacterium]|nr:hypothetical protein [Acidobacteriota bacterium]
MQPGHREDGRAPDRFWSALLSAERSRQKWLWQGNIMPEVGFLWVGLRAVWMALTFPVRPFVGRWRRRQALRRRLRKILQ